MPTTHAPLIGVCAAYNQAKWTLWDMPAALVSEAYLQHVKREGAVPVGLLPTVETAENAERLVQNLDGLFLLGGSDVDPASYGRDPEPGIEATVPIRDQSEIALARAAIDAGIPVFGICRGLQVLNVVNGGTLHQHLEGESLARHRKYNDRISDDAVHEIEVQAGSLVAEAIGAGSHTVNSYHHQAVDIVGGGGRVTAVSPADAVVEAVEWGSGFTVGVQWHPEVSTDHRVINAFINACKERRA